MKGGILWAALCSWLVAASSIAADSATFTHDANGNLTSRTEGGVEWTYAYNSRDQLREVLRNGIIFEVYQYDAQGRRVRKTSADGIVRYVWDGDRVVQETDDFGNTIATYEYAGDRLVSVDHVTEGSAFYVLDALGSPLGLVRADGTVAARYHLDAWGVLRAEEGDSPNPFRFTGHQFDQATGLYYAKARYYDPGTGRFLSEDPFGGEPGTPASLHRYSYAFGNPTTYRDPDGRDAVEVTAASSGEQGMDVLSGQEEYALLVANGVPISLAEQIVAQGTFRGDIGVDRVEAMAPYIVGAGELSKYLLINSMMTGASGGLAGGLAGAARLGVVATDLLVGAASGGGSQLGHDIATGELSDVEDYFLSTAAGSVGTAYLGRIARGPVGRGLEQPLGSANAVIVGESFGRPGVALRPLEAPPALYSVADARGIQGHQFLETVVPSGPSRSLLSPRTRSAVGIAGENRFALAGRLAHKSEPLPPGFQREVVLPSGKRMDGYNPNTKEIIERKPNNPRAIRRGQQQVKEYCAECDVVFGKGHRGHVEIYDQRKYLNELPDSN